MMKRKPDESDASYISRLESSRAALEQNNHFLKATQKRLFDVIIPSAIKAGVVLQYAAEVTGMRGDKETEACIAALEKLASCGWHDDAVTIPDLPPLPRPEPEKFGGDVEMLLHSALEKAKCAADPWRSEAEKLHAKIGKLDASAPWDEIEHEVFDALCDLSVGRNMLRHDLRSTMYDYAFDRIAQAVRVGSGKWRDERDEVPEREYLPF